ncbi:hypothetical protein WJM97_21925 [Okeanomitos corallinicola TIOX110]|uniref:Holin n=1 Tax=Okeanomitos corallinicola TIOX110 TaxID=3133117 RepID=A0ABZ2URG6_9CYAN
MDVEQFLNIFLPVGGVIAAYFKINNDIQAKIADKNSEQDNSIEALEKRLDQQATALTYERRLTNEQQKNILKRVKYKLLSQDEKIADMTDYLKVFSEQTGSPQFRNRDSKLDIEFTRSLMNDDEPLGGDLNSETLS